MGNSSNREGRAAAHPAPALEAEAASESGDGRRPRGRRAPRGQKRSWWLTRRGEERSVGYLLLVPTIVGLGVFVVAPIAGAFYLSLTDWSGLGDRSFAGLDNYRELVEDKTFRHSLKVTAIYTAVFVPALYVIALGLALLVNQGLRLTGFFRSMFFIPFMLSLVVSSVIWAFMFDERGGILNTILDQVGIGPQPWLGSTDTALWAIVIVTVWQAVGYGMIIFLAGVQDIPRDYYEAARVDGASAIRQFWTITLPLLRPTSAFVIIVSLIGAIQLFDPIYVLTQGGPFNATTTTVFYMYETAFRFLRIGYASSLAVVLFLILLTVTLIIFRLFRHEPHY